MQNTDDIIKLKDSSELNEEEKFLVKEQFEKDLEFMNCQEIEDYYNISDSKRKNWFKLLNIEKKPLWGMKNLEEFSLEKENPLKNKRTIDIGNYVESKVIVRALELGYQIFTPMFTGSYIDLILEKESDVYKIQIKSCKSDSKAVYMKFVRTTYSEGEYKHFNYKESQIDAFVTYAFSINKFIWIPSNMALKDGRNCLTLRITERLSPHHDEPVYVKDFIW